MANKALMSLQKSGKKAMVSVKKHSPEILLGVSVVAGVATVITACRATLKVDGILDNHKDSMEDIRAHFEEGSKELKKETVKVYAKTGWEFAKQFGLSAALGCVSVGCQVKSYKILKKRNIELEHEVSSLTAWGLGLSESFRQYRKRIKEKYGEEIENEIYNNLKEIEIEERQTDEKGKTKTVKKKKKVVGPEGASIYARYVTRSNPDFHPDPAVMDMYVRAQQAHLNDLLEASDTGLLMINEAYRCFNLKEYTDGFTHGWKFDPKATSHINITCTPVAMPVVDADGVWNGDYEDAYLLDFNCHGNVYALQKELEID